MNSTVEQARNATHQYYQYCRYNYDLTLQVVLTFAYAVIFPISLLGNSLVLFVVYRHHTLRNALNYLIVNMAIADLLVTIFTMPYSVSYLYIQNRWFGGVFGEILCKVVQSAVAISIAASIFTLTTITIDRFISIVYVWKQTLTLGTSKLALVLIWVFSVGMFGFYFRAYRVNKSARGLSCDPKYDFAPEEFPKYFAVCMFVFLYAVPLALMAVLYSIICRKLFKKEMGGGGDEQINNKKKRVIKMLITCTIFFAICWLPLHVLHFLIYFDLMSFLCSPLFLRLFGFWLGHANSALNPILYVIFNKTFRKAFLNALHIKAFDSLNSTAGPTTRRSTLRKQAVSGPENNNKRCDRRSPGRFRMPFVKVYAKLRNGGSEEDPSEPSSIDKRKSTMVVSERMTCL